ncbi:MAG: TrkH family potassium uptake protein [Brevirhabdus sp.]
MLKLPFLVLLMGIGAAAMYVPSFHALSLRDYETSRIFFYSGTFFLVLTSLVGLATANGKPIRDPRQHLAALAAGFVLLPLMLAVPLSEVVRDTTFLNAWFEMVSSLTTTGATIFDRPDRLPDAVHLWRVIVGWMGGLLAWIAAIAVLAPLNLGGFEVISGAPLRGESSSAAMGQLATPSERLQRFAADFFPIYTALTIILWVGLIITGLDPFPAIALAMSTMASSGIVPFAMSGESVVVPFGAELLILFFFIFAFTRQSFTPEPARKKLRALRSDPELRLAAVLIVILPTLLFLRHWFGAFEVDRTDDIRSGLSALWGGVFTVASFLSTTGFVSDHWADAQGWSGLGTPGLILTGLALFGGGVATTAGGVKLMRVLALYRHGVREMDKLAHPSLIAGSALGIGRRATYIAWIFFMLFALTVALVMLILSLTGQGFEQSATLAIAAISTTGPLAQVAVDPPISYALLSTPAKLTLAFAMIIGRLEALALVALFNPDFWRR